MVLELNNNNFEEEVIKSKLPVIVDFWANWCGPCKMMAPIFEELSAEFEGKLKFTKLSTENSPEIAQKYNIRGIPCLIIFKNGEEAGRIIGLNPKPLLKEKIENALG